MLHSNLLVVLGTTTIFFYSQNDLPYARLVDHASFILRGVDVGGNLSQLVWEEWEGKHAFFFTSRFDMSMWSDSLSHAHS
jgi:hypothetical protein